MTKIYHKMDTKIDEIDYKVKDALSKGIDGIKGHPDPVGEKGEEGCMAIPYSLYKRLKYLGIIPDEIRSANVGNSNYATRTIQPWSVWLDWELNAFDADIVKRVGRVKVDAGYTPKEQRILDYKKIKHICDERIRQLENE